MGISKNKRLQIIFFAIFLFYLPGNAYSFFGSGMTGGMSEVFIGDARIRVAGGFIERFEKNEVYVRAKAVELSIDVDNSASGESGNFDFIVSNINPEITEVVGWDDGEIKKGKNSLTFPVKVEAKKIAVYRVAPKLAEDGFSFMVFGESRGGRHVLNRIIGDINYRKPLFVVSCGDMVEKATSGGYDAFIKEIGEVRLPFFTVAGESEIENGSLGLYHDYMGPSYYSFDYRKSHFVFVNNGDGEISEEQFLWLENDLMQSKAANKFVFMHLPVFDPRPGRDAPLKKGGQFRRLSAMLAKYRVNFVFSSGIHGYFKEDRDGVSYTITGGGGSELATTDAFYNYVIVEVKGEKATDKLIKLASLPLPWYSATYVKVKIYLKAYFKAHPVRITVLLIILASLFLLAVRSLQQRFFKRDKRRISF